jgi:hypothetical protein
LAPPEVECASVSRNLGSGAVPYDAPLSFPLPLPQIDSRTLIMGPFVLTFILPFIQDTGLLLPRLFARATRHHMRFKHRNSEPGLFKRSYHFLLDKIIGEIALQVPWELDTGQENTTFTSRAISKIEIKFALLKTAVQKDTITVLMSRYLDGL